MERIHEAKRKSVRFNDRNPVC